MSKFYFSGIQQVGIGNPNTAETWRWYRQNFGFNVPVFEEEAVAALMLPYTGGEKHARKAVLALNMNGGGGLEIWQYTQRELIWPQELSRPGDLGISVLKIKTRDVAKAYAHCQQKGLKLLGKVQYRHGRPSHFYLRDLHNNLVEITYFDTWYKPKGGLFGGVAGVAIGVSDLQQSLRFYKQALGFNQVVFEEKGQLEDLALWDEKPQQYQRVILEREAPYRGAFSPLLGPAQIELIKVEDKLPKKLFENRFWGDPGYIHLCFDTVGMDAFENHVSEMGHPFTVDSAQSFDMGEAAGRFAYIEDPDGTLLEFVETHKVPILKKLNWYLNLQKRDATKPLPRWMINTMGWSKVKD
jgi:catechol 2,3-dioxygenase-like lactoylglutathione lyase family enzyme